MNARILNLILSLLGVLTLCGYLLGCSNGSSSSTPATKSSNIASVEINVSSGGIIKVVMYPNSGQNQDRPLVIQYPHGKFYYLSTLQAKKPIAKHYFPTLAAYLAARSKYDKAYVGTNVVRNSGKLNQHRSNTTGLSFANGYDIGVIPSTSYNIIGSGSLDNSGNPLCYNYTAQVVGGGSGAFTELAQAEYTSQATTDSGTLGIAANISASDGLYSGSASVSYNSSYQGSQASSSFSFFNYLSAEVLLSVESISTDGVNLLLSNPDQFIAECGNSVVTSIPMGYSIAVNTNDSSSSSAQNSSLSASMSASYASLDSFSSSVNTSSSSNSTSDSIGITLSPEGDYIFPPGWSLVIGGVSYTSTVNNLLSANDILDEWEDANPNVCTTGTATPAQCNTYMQALNNEQIQIMGAVTEALNQYGLPDNLSLLAYYPNGVQLGSGGNTNGMITQNITTIPTIAAQLQALATSTESLAANDAWLAYAPQLTSYIQLMYQINQLYLRSNAFYQIIAGTYSGYASPSNLDYNGQLAGNLSNLANSYLSDIPALETIVSNCLTNISTCSSMPDLGGESSAYNFYSDSNLYSQVMTAAGQVANTQFITDKQYSAIFLQYEANYIENATLASPSNTSPADSHYNGTSTPTVNNTVPMGIVYIASDNLYNNQSQGLLGFALQGITEYNPYWPYTGNGQSSIDQSPFITSQTTSVPAQQFQYNFATNNIAGFLNTPFTAASNLNSIFNLPSKIVNGAHTVHDAAYGSGVSGYYPTNTLISSGDFEISPNAALPTFSIIENGALYNGNYPVAGVFGPAGVGVYSHQFYNILETGSNGTTPLAVPTISSSYTLTMANANFSQCNLGSETSYCTNGGYPFGDIVYPSSYTTIDPLLVNIKSTKNTLSLTPIQAFFP